MQLGSSYESVADNNETNKLVLTKIEQTSSDDIVEMTSSDGSVFFIRLSYLQLVNVESIKNAIASTVTFSECEANDILQAGFAFSAERKANDYLARCEQCRYKLTQKLIQKGFEKNAINLALNRLEAKNYLSDSRFALVWVRSHCISNYQGKTRLLSELLLRGIQRTVALEAINCFFSENEEGITEESMCEKAYQKAVRQRKSGEKLIKYLLDSGFSYKMVISKINEHKENS